MNINWAELSEGCGFALEGGSARALSGGSISSAWRVESERGPVFMKLEAPGAADRLEAEADGLVALAGADVIRVPRVLAHGVSGTTAFLVLEHISQGRGGDAAERLGEQLAELHRVTGGRFGWHRDNFIGSTPQLNRESDDPVTFLREQRLAFQYRLAVTNGYRLSEARMLRLLDGLADFYEDYRPVASLLHGDLWGGNWFADEAGRPVIFDPAVYFGDREADLAMSELFGGFGPEFYAAYDAVWSLHPGYPVRRDLHKLYHILNHLNLFGGAYLGQAASLLDRLSVELG